MGIRETINEKNKVAVIIAIVIIVAGGTFVGWYFVTKFWPRFSHHRASNKGLEQCYYAAEDGTGVFIDDAKNIPPFDHNGKPAYRAILFKGADHKPFVQHLESYEDDAKKEIEKQIGITHQPPLLVQHSADAMMHMQVRRPTDPPGIWAKASDHDAKDWAEIMVPNDKNGPGPFAPVSIEENAQP